MQHRNWHYDFEYSNNLFNKGIGSEDFFKAIEVALPPVVSRAELARLTGGLISAKTLSNEDALNKGPGERVRAGSKVGYTKASAMVYLRKKLRLL
ncbi:MULTISPECIES: hypothetical protein [Desulfovibrio]|uniref:Uncharacterized protein n=1 Tax=Desulfovibrio desulfuricans TaxID=876 RepID=A0AA94HVE2_DESDE|nr:MULTISPECIES: hypothetical protein [Desulfovibrio]ATD80521.1 hypothetical protein CNY67_03055 [Desulfovibrio sp. G11]SFW74069.1 hypothetical protein SAMN02910291_02847 [Desulfovibrio desulfuricans]SPD36010.1 Hypothetical protein DSVG11_1914 [Desulfovibrio sp. G11]